MKRVWSKLPSRWIREGALHAFGPDGGAAALKLYMALALWANFKPSPTAEVAGLARLTFSELETRCDISRRYVSRGLALLAAEGLITVERIGTAHRYRLTRFEEPGWAKLPRAHLLAERRFQSLGIRGPLYLHALKLYLALVTFRDNESAHVPLSYDKIEHYTGVARPHIRRAIDVLINHDWIAVASRVPEVPHRRPANIYILRGDFWGRHASNYARASLTTLSS